MNLSIGFLSGCGAESRSSVFTVEGKLIIGGEPVANASLAFHPTGKNASKVCPVGITRADGSYRLTTYASEDGAPAGEYVVTIIWPDDSIPIDECKCEELLAHDRLHGLFADCAHSTLRATVRPGPNEIAVRVEDRENLFLKKGTGPFLSSETDGRPGGAGIAGRGSRGVD